MSDLISREEVLNLIDTAFENGAFDGRYAYENLVDAVQNLIHPLETDLISRKAAETLFRNARKALMEQSRKEHIKDFNTRDLMLLNAEQLIHLLPSVEPERKSGKWMPHMVTAKCESIDHDVCSECHVCFYGEPTWSWKYCPNCGKPMEVQNAKDINVPTKLDDFDRSGEEWR